MNSYRVEYMTQTSLDGGAVHVNATTRENAVYAAFDELTDKGFNVVSIGDVYLWDEESRWVLTHSHRTISQMVA